MHSLVLFVWLLIATYRTDSINAYTVYTPVESSSPIHRLQINEYPVVVEEAGTDVDCSNEDDDSDVTYITYEPVKVVDSGCHDDTGTYTVYEPCKVTKIPSKIKYEKPTEVIYEYEEEEEEPGLEEVCDDSDVTVKTITYVPCKKYTKYSPIKPLNKYILYDKYTVCEDDKTPLSKYIVYDDLDELCDLKRDKYRVHDSSEDVECVKYLPLITEPRVSYRKVVRPKWEPCDEEEFHRYIPYKFVPRDRCPAELECIDYRPYCRHSESVYEPIPPCSGRPPYCEYHRPENTYYEPYRAPYICEDFTRVRPVGRYPPCEPVRLMSSSKEYCGPENCERYPDEYCAVKPRCLAPARGYLPCPYFGKEGRFECHPRRRFRPHDLNCYDEFDERRPCLPWLRNRRWDTRPLEQCGFRHPEIRCAIPRSVRQRSLHGCLSGLGRSLKFGRQERGTRQAEVTNHHFSTSIDPCGQKTHVGGCDSYGEVKNYGNDLCGNKHAFEGDLYVGGRFNPCCRPHQFLDLRERLLGGHAVRHPDECGSSETCCVPETISM
ncbi:unnamed protein product [Calicophoron daubneyi]|uniref:Uncharacterized protein n=1 Tax=Calicophoron daubneyi TaxID=300641 RepID=A0AAV2TLS2_CALDB